MHLHPNICITYSRLDFVPIHELMANALPRPVIIPPPPLSFHEALRDLKVLPKY